MVKEANRGRSKPSWNIRSVSIPLSLSITVGLESWGRFPRYLAISAPCLPIDSDGSTDAVHIACHEATQTATNHGECLELRRRSPPSRHCYGELPLLIVEVRSVNEGAIPRSYVSAA